MGKSSSSKKRPHLKSEQDEEMASIRVQIAADRVEENDREASRQKDREEAANARVTMTNMAADIAAFREDMADAFRILNKQLNF